MAVVGDIGKGSNPSPLRLYGCVDMDGVIKITNGEANEKEAVSYKCVQCGAPLTFLPGDDKVTCEYCGTNKTSSKVIPSPIIFPIGIFLSFSLSFLFLVIRTNTNKLSFYCQ